MRLADLALSGRPTVASAVTARAADNRDAGLPPQNFTGHPTGGPDGPPRRWPWRMSARSQETRNGTVDCGRAFAASRGGTTASSSGTARVGSGSASPSSAGIKCSTPLFTSNRVIRHTRNQMANPWIAVADRLRRPVLLAVASPSPSRGEPGTRPAPVNAGSRARRRRAPPVPTTSPMGRGLLVATFVVPYVHSGIRRRAGDSAAGGSLGRSPGRSLLAGPTQNGHSGVLACVSAASSSWGR